MKKWISCFVILFCQENIAQESPEKQLGLWRTPGGNVVDIRYRDNSLKGYLLEVNELAKKYGFKPGDVALQNFNTTEADAEFEVLIRGEEPSYTPTYQAVKNVLQSRSTMRGTLADGYYDKTSKEYVATDTRAQIEYSRVTAARPASSIVVTDLRRLKMTDDKGYVHSASSANPFGMEKNWPRVEFKFIDGEAVQFAEIVWQVKNQSKTWKYTSITNEHGIAYLQLALQANGSFAPTNQLWGAPSNMIPSGEYSLTVKSSTYKAKAVSSKLQLSAGVILRVRNKSGKDYPFLYYSEKEKKKPVYFEVIDHSVAFEPEREREFVTLTVGYPSGAYSYKLPRKGAGRYALDSAIRIPRPDKNGFRLALGVKEFLLNDEIYTYLSPEGIRLGFLEQTIKHYQSIISYDALKEAYPAQSNARKILKQKYYFLERGLEAINMSTDEGWSEERRLAIGTAYLNLARKKKFMTRKSRFARLPKLISNDYDRWTVRFSSEKRMVERAAKMALRRNIKNFSNVDDEFYARFLKTFSALPGQIKNAPATIAKGVQLFISEQIAVIAFDIRLDGETPTTMERLFAGLELATLRLNTPPKLLPFKVAAGKIDDINDLRKAAGKFGFEIQNYDDYMRALHARRWDQLGDELISEILDSKLPDKLKRAQLAVLARVSNYKTAAKIRKRLDYLKKFHPVQGLSKIARRDIGFLKHLIRYHDNLAYWNWLVKEGKAVKTKRGGYRAKGADGKLGDIEELFEWSIPDAKKKSGKSRVDHAMINHRDKTIFITDLTGQYNLTHSKKTFRYRKLVKELADEDIKGFKAFAHELYWDESSRKLIERVGHSFGWTTYP